jgi:hypothetical protein
METAAASITVNLLHDQHEAVHPRRDNLYSLPDERIRG